MSDTFVSIYTTVKWISSLSALKLQDKSYLIKAKVEIREEQDQVRYDKIRF